MLPTHRTAIVKEIKNHKTGLIIEYLDKEQRNHCIRESEVALFHCPHNKL